MRNLSSLAKLLDCGTTAPLSILMNQVALDKSKRALLLPLLGGEGRGEGGLHQGSSFFRSDRCSGVIMESEKSLIIGEAFGLRHYRAAFNSYEPGSS